jgi:hypothetical protein
MSTILIKVYYSGENMNTPTGVNYNNGIACTFSVNDGINVDDLMR